MKRNIVIILCNVVMSMLMTKLGYDFTTWQWWLAIVIVSISFIGGFSDFYDNFAGYLKIDESVEDKTIYCLEIRVPLNKLSKKKWIRLNIKDVTGLSQD